MASETLVHMYTLCSNVHGEDKRLLTDCLCDGCFWRHPTVYTRICEECGVMDGCLRLCASCPLGESAAYPWDSAVFF